MALMVTPEVGASRLEPGNYVVTCMDIKKDELAKSQFNDPRVFRWILEVRDQQDEDGNPIELDAISSQRITPAGKTWAWIEAFGVRVELDVTFDIEDVVGKSALALVGERKTEKGSFPRVEDITPLPKGMTMPAPVQRKEAPVEEDKALPVAEGGRQKAGEEPEPDYTTFWKQVASLGKTREDVKALLSGQNMLAMQDQTGADLVVLLEKLSA